MDWIIILAITCGISVAQGLFLGIWLLLKDKRTFGPNMFLGIAMLAISLRIGKSLVYYFWSDMSLWGVAVGGAGLWAIGPAVFWYLRTLQGKEENRAFYLLFVPSFLLLFSATIFGWMEMHRVYQFGIAYLVLLLVVGISRYWNTSFILQKQPMVFLITIGVIVFAFIFQIATRSIASYAIGGLVASVALYGINIVVTTTQLSKSKLKPADTTLLEAIHKKIRIELDEGQLYRQSKLTLSKLSEAIGEPVYMVRQTIGKLEGKNFNEFINTYRIDEVKRLLDKNSQQYTIEGMAQDVGFTSTSSFYEAFKKITNVTPTEYKKSKIVELN